MIRNAFYYISIVLLLASCHVPDGKINIKKNKKGGLYEMAENGKGLPYSDGDSIAKVDTVTYISFNDFENISRMKSDIESNYTLNFKLNDAGSLKLKDMTIRNTNKPIYFVVEDIIMCAPIVNGPISEGKIEMVIPDEKTGKFILEYLSN